MSWRRPRRTAILTLFDGEVFEIDYNRRAPRRRGYTRLVIRIVEADGIQEATGDQPLNPIELASLEAAAPTGRLEIVGRR